MRSLRPWNAWRTAEGLPANVRGTLVADSFTPGRFLVAGTPLRESTDGGRTWRVPAGLEKFAISSLAADAATPGLFAAVGYAAVYVSRDGAKSFSVLPKAFETVPSSLGRTVYLDRGRLYFLTTGTGVWVREIGGAPSELPVIPKVKRYVTSGTETWRVGKTLRVTAENPAAVSVGKRLTRDWKRCARGFAAGTVDVTLRLAADAPLGDEGYRLTLTPTGATIAAPTRTGLVWGTQTLLQLARSGQAVAVGTIEDWPDYPVRGVTFDVARKFFPMSYLRDLVRELSYCKMNTFHVHLNDDVVFSDKAYWAFRLESDVPGLTSRDGSYTKAEFRAFVREAAEQGVNVVPEIDAPGHSLAFRMVRPDLALTNGWDQLDVNKPGTLAFIKSVWDEYLDGSDPVFAGPDVHVGTDEYCRGSIEGYRAFADAIFRHVRGKGKRIGAWGAFGTCTGRTEVVAAPDIVLDLWHHKSYPPEQALKDGYSVTAVPGSLLSTVPGAPY